jgi:hypothetical protein
MLSNVIELLPLSLVILYYVPFMVAAARDHDSLIPILLVNTAFGWTGIGWLLTLTWAWLAPAGNATPPPYVRRIQ